MHLRIAGLTVDLRAGDSLSGLLHAYYAAMATDNLARADATVEAHDDAASVSVGTRLPQTFRIFSPAAAPTVAAALVLRCIAQARPDFVFLHGNALLDVDRKRAILVVGESGAGKTTLARGLAHADARVEPLSEDVLVLDPSSRTLHPFPRTPTVAPPEAPRDAPTWGGKRLLPWHGSRVVDAVPLDDAHVVVLERGSAASSSHVDREGGTLRVIVPWLDDEAADAVARDCPSFRGWHRDGDLFALAFAPLPPAPELKRAAGILDAKGCLLLATEVVGSGGTSNTASRAAVPGARALTAGEGIAALLAHRISPCPAERGAPGAFMASLARAFSAARFTHVVRGATPGETARMAIDAIHGGAT